MFTKPFLMSSAASKKMSYAGGKPLMNEISSFSQAMDFFLQYRRDDSQFPRSMGSKNSHACKLQQHLHDQMLAQSEFCDVTLIAGDIEMKAHWSVMVSCPYFQSLYDSNMTEKREGRITIGVGKPTAVRSAINFLYTGTLEITYNGVRDILEVADYLQIADLKKACTDYLSSVEVTIDNCVDLSLLASLYDLDIYNRVFEYVRGHLPEVMKQSEMLSLTPDSITEMLKDKSLNYVPVEEFYKFIVRWVEHDEVNRKCYFEDMFCELELKNMSQEFLEKSVETSQMVVESDVCKVRVLNIKMKHMTGLISNEDTKDVILLVGGSGGGQFFGSFFSSPFFPLSDVMSINNVYAYVVQEDRWTELAPLPYSMRQPLVAYNKQTNCLYVIDNSNYTATCVEQDTLTLYLFRYNVVERTWKSLRVKLPDCHRDISIYNIHIANNQIFILVAGRIFNEPTGEREFEVFMLKVKDDLQSEICCKLFSKNTKTKVSSCVVDDRYVCVLGFKCGRGNPNTRSKQNHIKFMYFDALHNKRFENSKPVIGAEFLMLPIKGELCLTKFGAYKVNKFNFHKGKWQVVKNTLLVPHPLVEPARSDCIYTTFQNQMFVFGGKSSKPKELISSACKFDFETKSWTALEDIPKPLFQSGITTVKLPAEHIRCHINCPHCKYQTARSLASYEIDYPDDDEDEDEDLSYEDEDAYNYSDYWDDDFYNEYSDQDWF